jgi:MFS family permease
MMAWMNRDGKLLVAARAVRSFTSGFFAIALSIYLKLLGYNTVLIGIALTVSLVSTAAYTIASSYLERKYGRRKLLVILVLLSTLGGGIFVASTNYVILLIAMCIGTISYAGGGGGSGPFAAMEQGMLAQTMPAEKRTLGYATFNTAARLAGSGGALLTSAPVLFQNSGLGVVESFRIVFSVTVVGIFSLLFFFLALSGDAEAKEIGRSVLEEKKKPGPMLSPDSKRKIAKLSSLIGLDAFGGGFVIQNIASLWFFTKFGASFELLSVIFFAAGLVTTSCFLVSAKISDRIGLINTMVFTHLPSNITTMLIPLAPTLTVAVAMYLARAFLSQMDIAPRQSYIAAIVNPDERIAAAGFTNVSNNLSQAVSPSLSGYLMQFAGTLSFPFFISGGLKAIYDIVLYFNFRALKTPEEMQQRGRV